MSHWNRAEKRAIQFGRGFSETRKRHMVRFAAGIELEMRRAWRDHCQHNEVNEDQDENFIMSSCGEYDYHVLLPEDGFDN